MLATNHILVVCTDRDDANCQSLVARLKSLNAIVHVTDSHTQALGTYWLLYDQNIFPRAVITDWYLMHPGSEEFKFMTEFLDKKDDVTAKPLITNIRAMDRNVVIIVEADDVSDVPSGLADYVVKRPFEPQDMIATLLSDPVMKRQRLNPAGLRTRSGLFTMPG